MTDSTIDSNSSKGVALGNKLIDDITSLVINTLGRISGTERIEKSKEIENNLDPADSSLEEMSAVTTVGAMGHMDNSRGQRDEQ